MNKLYFDSGTRDMFNKKFLYQLSLKNYQIHILPLAIVCMHDVFPNFIWVEIFKIVVILKPIIFWTHVTQYTWAHCLSSLIDSNVDSLTK